VLRYPHVKQYRPSIGLHDSSTGVQWPTTSYNFDFYGNPSKFTDPRGNFTTYTFSSTYQNAYLTSKTQLDGATSIITSYSYNSTTGNVQSTTDPMNNVTNYKNDNLGRTTRIIYPLSAYVNYTYNDIANYVDVINENKTKTRQIYDGLARLSVIDRFLNGKSYSNDTYTYNWQNKVVTHRDALNSTYYSQYDVLGRITNSTRPDGKSTPRAYNDAAAWTTNKDEDNNYRCNIFDRLGRLLTVVEFADSACNALFLSGYYYVTSYYYDEIGNLRTLTTLPSNRFLNPGFETGLSPAGHKRV